MIHFGDWLRHWSQRTPSAEALFEPDTGRRWTYAQLDARANRLACALQELGVQRGDRVAVLAHNCGEQLELLFACGKLGAVHSPLNWRLTAHELDFIVRDAEPHLLFFDRACADLADALPASRRIVFGAPYESLLAAATSDAPPPWPPAGLEDPIILLYTSGTTGHPKGALLPHRQLIYNSHNTDLAVGLSARDSTLVFLPLFHTGGLNCLATPLLHRGGRVVLLGSFDAERVSLLTERERISTHMGVPTTFQMIAEQPAFGRADWSSVRFALCGGAPCPLGLIETYRERGVLFRQGYGLTEVGPNDFSLTAEDAFRKAGSIGFPNFYLNARIVDDSGGDVGPDQVGELVLRGPVVCLGYFRNPAATAAALRDGWFFTGDLARRDAQGYHFIVDRKKDMFISGGENVYPAEIEQALAAHPDVAEAAVIGVADARWGEVGRALVALRAGASAREADLVAHCQSRLARFKVPRSIVLVPALPRGASGKVLKPALKERYGKA
ncbi:MAG TPA: long-chain fatty acid--CoA ligase [Polyangia bacterium]|nr:long-chain fatty acid--CoA ligase [Polyangia bacterium]